MLSRKQISPRSPKTVVKNFRVIFNQEGDLSQKDKTFISTLIPKIARQVTETDQNQKRISIELTKYFQRTVGVAMIENCRFGQSQWNNHYKKPSVVLTMNEFLYQIWFYEIAVQFEKDPFGKRQQQ